MKPNQTLACLLMAVSVVTAGCDEESRAISKRLEQPRGKPSYVSATVVTWHPHQTVTGRVVLRRKVTLRAAHAGRVTACPWQVGQIAERGRILLRLTGPRIDGPRRMLEDDMKIMREQQTKAQADMHRFSVLLEKGIVSKDDKGGVAARAIVHERALSIDKVKDELAQLEAAATVTISVAGRILELLVRDGSDVVADQPLAVLSVPSELAIEGAVFPMHGVRVRPGTRAEVHLDAHADPIEARVDYLLPQAERSTGASQIGIFLDKEAGQLRPGQRVRIDLLGDAVETIVVPSSAVVSRAGKTFCVKRSGDGWQAVEVSVVDSDAGTSDTAHFAGGRTFLSDGLNPGDEVMTEGAYGTIYRDFRELFTFED